MRRRLRTKGKKSLTKAQKKSLMKNNYCKEES